MKRNYKHILFPFVLCGLMAAQTSAAPGIVKGRITDTQGKPVAQVVVTDGTLPHGKRCRTPTVGLHLNPIRLQVTGNRRNC